MKKPKKGPQEIIEEWDHIGEGSYTSNALRDIAKEMDEQNIKQIYLTLECDYDYNRLVCKAYRTETQEEADKRYERESRLYNAEQKAKKDNLAKKKAKVIEEAKKLGLTVVDAE